MFCSANPSFPRTSASDASKAAVTPWAGGGPLSPGPFLEPSAEPVPEARREYPLPDAGQQEPRRLHPVHRVVGALRAVALLVQPAGVPEGAAVRLPVHRPPARAVE